MCQNITLANFLEGMQWIYWVRTEQVCTEVLRTPWMLVQEKGTNLTFWEGGLCFDISMSFIERSHKFSVSQGETTNICLTIRANSPSLTNSVENHNYEATKLEGSHADKVEHLIQGPSPPVRGWQRSPPPPTQYKPVLSTVEQQGWNPISAGSLGWLGHEQEAFRHRPGPRWQRPPHSRWTQSNTDGGESVVGGFSDPSVWVAQWHRQLG